MAAAGTFGMALQRRLKPKKRPLIRPAAPQYRPIRPIPDIPGGKGPLAGATNRPVKPIPNLPQGKQYVATAATPHQPAVAPPVTYDNNAEQEAAPWKDSSYWAEIARQKWAREGKMGEITQQNSYAQADYKEALKRALEPKGQDEERAREQANEAGLFYSGQLGKRQGEIGSHYARVEGDMTQAEQRRQAAFEAAKRAIEEGATYEEAAAEAAAVDRQAGRDLGAADQGALAPVAGPGGEDEAPAAPPPGYGVPTNKGQPFTPQRVARTPPAGRMVITPPRQISKGVGTIQQARRPPKPSAKPKKGYEWAFKNGKWTQVKK
jgi:hypothetical protein